ncbi:hypothetical protein M0R45_030587 [Rubus argutus]|uniref:Uncharacterized protein n=1 Tax=Rubus argutus TaxID=59490 RepID=A0AAW1WE34_RUBAR
MNQFNQSSPLRPISSSTHSSATCKKTQIPAGFCSPHPEAVHPWRLSAPPIADGNIIAQPSIPSQTAPPLRPPAGP